MALVEAAVNLARVMTAIFANPLSPPMWTSAALRARVFKAAVLTSVALRARVFKAAVLTPAALRALVFAAVVLTLQTLHCRPGRNFTHFAPRMHVACILALAARTSFDSEADTLTPFSAAPRVRLRTVLPIGRRRRAASCRAWPC